MADNEEKQETEAEAAKTASAGGESPLRALEVVVVASGWPWWWQGRQEA